MPTPAQGSSAGLYDHLYYNTGTYTTPAWVEIDGVSDVNLGDECNDIAIKIRRFKHEIHLRGQRKKELTFNMLTEVNGTPWIAINAAFNADPGTVMDFLVMIVGTSVLSGSIGFRLQVEIMDFPKKQSLEDADMNEVKAVPAARYFSTETTIHEPAVFVVT